MTENMNKTVTKPSSIYFRPANFLADNSRKSLPVIGAYMLLCSHMMQRWQPDKDPLPFLPNDDELLRKLCNYTKAWHKIRTEVLLMFTEQDGKLYSPWVSTEMSRLADHAKRNGEKKERTKKEKPAAPEKPTAPPKSSPAELEAAAMAAQKKPPRYRLQGRDARNFQEFQQMLEQGDSFRETDNTTLQVLDGDDSKLLNVKLVRMGSRWLVFDVKTDKGIRFDASGKITK